MRADALGHTCALFCAKCEYRESPSEVDDVFLMKSQTLAAAVTAIHYLVLPGLYGGLTALICSVFFIALLTDVISPAMQRQEAKSSAWRHGSSPPGSSSPRVAQT